MRRITVTTLVVVLALSGTAGTFAGGEKCDKEAEAKQAKLAESRCGKSAEDCVSAMAAKIQQKGWLGIETEKTGDGHYAIVGVEPYSPAQKAGFRKGDVLVALNGISLYSEDKTELKKVKTGLAVGAAVSYTVKRGDSKKVLDATLAEVPAPVMAQWIGEHMLDQHAHIEVASR